MQQACKLASVQPDLDMCHVDDKASDVLLARAPSRLARLLIAARFVRLTGPLATHGS